MFPDHNRHKKYSILFLHYYKHYPVAVMVVVMVTMVIYVPFGLKTYTVGQYSPDTIMGQVLTQ